MVKTLGKAGFLPQKTEGDHLLLKHLDGRTVTVPVKNPEIGPGLSDMMGQLQMTRVDFVALIQNPKKWRSEAERIYSTQKCQRQNEKPNRPHLTNAKVLESAGPGGYR